MKRRILIGVDVNEWKHPDGHQGFDLEKMKANWTEPTVRAIIQSLRSKALVAAARAMRRQEGREAPPQRKVA